MLICSFKELPMVSQTTSVEKSSPFQDLKTFKELIKLMDQSAKMRFTESLPPLTNKITSTLLHLKDQVPQNVCTQMIITCNNAATDIKFNPTLEASATTSELYCDSKLTEDFTSEHKSIMKSMRITPEPSNTKVSTGTITFDPGFLNTSSTVTDTVIPCKRLENKGFATLTTPKGTILSCTAMSTNLVSTRNMVCHTAPSLYQHTLKDACLGINIEENNIMKNDGTTSTTDITKAVNSTIGVSTTKLIDKSSFNCGSPKTQRSFNADFRPSMHSMSTNTEWAIQSRALIISNVAVTEVRNTNMNDAFVQYSDKEKNDTPKSVDSGRIGRSRLMSVRMLGDSFSDVDTQAKPSMANAETHTTPKGIVSASMLTSHFAFDKTVNVMKASKENNTDQYGQFIKHVKMLCLQTDTPDIKINKTWSNIPSRLEKQTDATEKTESHTKSTCRVEQRSNKSLVRPRNPSVVISSNLNAAKWMNGCTKDEYQSIIDISEMTVSESLERATLAVTNASEYKHTSDIVNSQEAAVNCVTAENMSTILTDNTMTDEIPVKDETKENVGVTESCHNQEDADASDNTKNLDKSSLQVRPNVCDADKKSRVKHKSACVLTSRHFLAKPLECQRQSKDHTDTNFEAISPTAKKTSNNSRTIGFVTSRQINCCKQTSAVIGGIMVPEVHTSGDHIEDQMASPYRYYSDLLSKKIIRFKQNVKRRLTNELDTFSPSHIYVEACTMKPSGRQDENLQVKIKKREIINQNCILSPTISAVDIRRNESHDLKTLYYMLTAIEGRVRRLKQNL
ncbi:unnamed protein product [Colias eurytheme]|nr:unnamed protein product [Colias eurytheme]